MALQYPLINLLLRSLPVGALKRLEPDLEYVNLPLRFKLAEPGRPCTWVYFPETGVASVMAKVGTTWQEVGIFGPEGVGCMSVLLGSSRVPYLIVMHVAGTGYRIPATSVLTAFQECEDTHKAFLRYVFAFTIQTCQSSIANARYNTVQRMTHWFLMMHDRVEGDSLFLTHESIARTLGVGRTGVTLALHTLEQGGMISTARKRITILDRPRLEAMIDGIYGFAEAEYRKLIGSLPMPHSRLATPLGDAKTAASR